MVFFALLLVSAHMAPKAVLNCIREAVKGRCPEWFVRKNHRGVSVLEIFLSLAVIELVLETHGQLQAGCHKRQSQTAARRIYC